jgi:beta-lactamase regulating signal transducer with metallopeptidase domain
MHALSQSPFLQALGYAIANSLWQVALLWIVVVLLNGVFKFSSPAKYKIALYTQFAGFTWFIITLQFYYTQCSEVIAQTQALSGFGGSSYAQIQSTDLQSYLLNGIIKAERLLPFLSLAYLFLLVFLSAKWMRSYRFAQSIKTEGLQKPDVHWKLFVRKISSLLNIKSEVKIYLSELVKSPLTVGFLKPIILIPVASINHLTTEQLEAVILHELAHIKRADYLINLFQSVIEMALFFNPFTQLLSRIIKKERENSCDDWVLQFQYNPTMYAEALLRIAYLQTQPALVMQATGTKGDLLPRVKRMLDKNQRTFNYRQQLIALLLMTGILSSVAWLQPATKKNIATANISTAQKSVQPIVEPMIARVDNPLFNPVSFLSKPIKEEINKAMVIAKKNLSDADMNDLNNAQNEFAKMLPPAIAELKKANIDTDIKLAMNQVSDSLQQIAATANEAAAKLDMEKQKLVDTALIANSLRSAYQQIKEINFQKIISQSLAGVKEQMAKIETDKQLINLKLAKEDLAKAVEMMKEKSMMAPLPPMQRMKDIAPAIKIKMDEEKILQDKEMKEQQQLEQKMDSLNEIKENAPQANNESKQNWSFSYPVYIQAANDDAKKNFAYNVVADSKDTSSVDQKIIYIKTTKKTVSKNNLSSSSADNIETVKITKTDDGKSVNLVIDIF